MSPSEQVSPALSISRAGSLDFSRLAAAFSRPPLNKTSSQYERYEQEQSEGTRVVLVASYGQEVAGYLNVIWHPNHQPFRDAGIPEIQDFNVLPQYRRRGVGRRLMDRAEELIGRRSATAGIAVGIYEDYGPAFRMYVKRGFIPDGRGVIWNDRQIGGGETIVVDDNALLYFTKELDRREHLARIAERLARTPLKGDDRKAGTELEPLLAHFQSDRKSADEGFDWCDAFVYRCVQETGYDLPPRHPNPAVSCSFAGVKAWVEWASLPDTEYFFEPSDVGRSPHRGDLVVFDDLLGEGPNDHIGVVVRTFGDEIETAEGNFDNASGIFRRSLEEHIRGFIRIGAP